MDEVGYGDGISVDKVVKVFRGQISVGVGDIIGWVVCSGVFYDLYSAYAITFGIDDEYNLSYYNYSFGGLNCVKPLCWFLD